MVAGLIHGQSCGIISWGHPRGGGGSLGSGRGLCRGRRRIRNQSRQEWRRLGSLDQSLQWVEVVLLHRRDLLVPSNDEMIASGRDSTGSESVGSEPLDVFRIRSISGLSSSGGQINWILEQSRRMLDMQMYKRDKNTVLPGTP